MSLDLLWKSKDNKIFKLGTLRYKDSLYRFNINLDELKKSKLNSANQMCNY